MLGATWTGCKVFTGTSAEVNDGTANAYVLPALAVSSVSPSGSVMLHDRVVTYINTLLTRVTKFKVKTIDSRSLFHYNGSKKGSQRITVPKSTGQAAINTLKLTHGPIPSAEGGRAKAGRNLLDEEWEATNI